MRRLLPVCLLILLSGSSVVAAPAKNGFFREIPELEPLHHYVGTWDVVVKSGQTPILLGETTAEWILDGHYIQQTASLHPKEGKPDVKFTTLMTYDPAAKLYRSWTFVSNGTRSESTGLWDTKTKTLTWTSHRDEAGSSSTTKADFSMPGAERVKIVVSGAAGGVVSEVTAENTRRK